MKYFCSFSKFIQSEELEEGEIALSGDSHMDMQQQSESWAHDREDGEDEQVLQPKIKRKRSIRTRPRSSFEKLEERSGGDGAFTARSSQLDRRLRSDQEVAAVGEPVLGRHGMNASSIEQRRNLPSRKVSPVVTQQKSGKLNYLSGPGEGSVEHSRGSWNTKSVIGSTGPFGGTKMSDSTQRKVCDLVCLR